MPLEIDLTPWRDVSANPISKIRIRTTSSHGSVPGSCYFPYEVRWVFTCPACGTVGGDTGEHSLWPASAKRFRTRKQAKDGLAHHRKGCVIEG